MSRKFNTLISPDYADLPEELVNELNIKRRGQEWQMKLRQVFKEAGGKLTKEQFMIAYYRLFQGIIDRKTAQRYLATARKYGIIRQGEKRGEYVLPIQ